MKPIKRLSWHDINQKEEQINAKKYVKHEDVMERVKKFEEFLFKEKDKSDHNKEIQKLWTVLIMLREYFPEEDEK